MTRAIIQAWIASAALAFTGCGVKQQMARVPSQPAHHLSKPSGRWQPLGAITHGGENAIYNYAILARNARHLMLEAPTECMPPVISFAVKGHPLAEPQPATRLNSRDYGATSRTVYRISAKQPVLINGVSLHLGESGLSCRINVYSSTR